MGLSRELLRIEKRVNDFTGRGLPSDFFFGDWEDGLDNLKRKMGISVAPTGIGGVGAGGIGPLPSNVSLLRGNINTVGGSASAMTGRFPQSTTRLPGRFTDTEDPPSSRQQAAAAARRLMNRPLGFSQKPPSGGGSSSSTSSTSSKNRKPSSSSKLGNYQPIMDYEGDMDDSERESDGNYSKPPIFLSSTSSSTSGPKASESSRGAIFDDINEEDLKLKQCCYDIITKLIGFNPNVLQVPNATTPPSPSASSLTRLSTSTGTGGGIGGSGMHSSPNFDENLSKSSFTRRLSHARRSSIDSTTEDEQTPSLASMNSASSSTNSLCSDPCSVLQIDGYSAGQVIVKEGDRVDGLYFVIHGLVEASMKARTDEMTEGSQFSAPDPYHHRDELDSPATQKSKDLDPDHRAFKKSLFLIREGGLAGYLSALTGKEGVWELIFQYIITRILSSFLQAIHHSPH